MIICTRPLTIGRNIPSPSPRRDAILRERMRLSRLSFTRGLVGDFRPPRKGGTRRELPIVPRTASAPRVVSARHAYEAFVADHRAFGAWGKAQDLTRATAPLVRGTRSLGGGLIPLCNARHLY